MNAKVVYVSKSGKSVIAQVVKKSGEFITRPSGFIELSTPGSKALNDTIELPDNAYLEKVTFPAREAEDGTEIPARRMDFWKF
jgi:hypothetical protein